MTTYICKCGQRVQKSSNADNTGNRLEGYGPGHECYGCPYAMPWGGNKWDEAAKRFVQDIKGYECRTSRTLSYDSHFIGSTKDKCTCSVVSLDFDFLEQISAWVKDTFPLGEITGNFSRDEIRPTDYSHNGRYCCTFVCASNKKGIAAKAALFARFFNPDGSRKDITPQQEMEKILADIEKQRRTPHVRLSRMRMLLRLRQRVLCRMPRRKCRPPRRARRMQAHQPPLRLRRAANRALPHRRKLLLRLCYRQPRRTSP